MILPCEGSGDGDLDSRLKSATKKKTSELIYHIAWRKFELYEKKIITAIVHLDRESSYKANFALSWNEQ